MGKSMSDYNPDAGLDRRPAAHLEIDAVITLAASHGHVVRALQAAGINS
jgi:hypothetical protein